jgi:hypothetical protein
MITDDKGHDRFRASGYAPDVEFSRELRDAVLSGDVTVTFRLWRTARVKVGGRYRVGSGAGSGQIEVDSVELLPFAALDEDDLARSGEADLESLRRRAAHAGPVHDDTLLYRVEFHVVPSPSGVA